MIYNFKLHQLGNQVRLSLITQARIKIYPQFPLGYESQKQSL